MNEVITNPHFWIAWGVGLAIVLPTLLPIFLRLWRKPQPMAVVHPEDFERRCQWCGAFFYGYGDTCPGCRFSD